MPFPRVTLLVSAALTLAGSAAHAQTPPQRDLGAGLGGGATVPLGSFKDDAKAGFHGAGFLRYRKGTNPFGVQVEGQYHRNALKPAACSDPAFAGLKCHTSTLYVGAVGLLEIARPGSRYKPYVLAGGGMYTGKVSASAGGVSVNSDGKAKFGFNGGAGIRFGMGTANGFIEARFHQSKASVDTDAATLSYVPLTFGIIF